MTDNTTTRVQDIEYNDVSDFHDKFNFINGHRQVQLLTRAKLTERYECMLEEVTEFKDAIATNDVNALADALIDLVYFAKGTAVMMGLPWETLWDDVHRANMTKVRGVTKRGHAFDVVKPDGWEGPKTAEIVTATGFDITKFQDTRKEAVALVFDAGEYRYDYGDVTFISDDKCVADAPEQE